jgi:nucleoside-diphosphate-sugar epimerase
MAPLADPVLVTGATGFIGRRLSARLASEGARVRALVLPNDPFTAQLPPAVEVRPGDVTDADAVASAVAGAGTVIHLAAVVGDWGPDALFERVTVGGTRNVLGAAARAGARAVLASSVVYYGDAIGRDVCHEDHPAGRPLGPYSRTKQAQEQIARDLAAGAGLRVTIVRPTNVFGPGSRPWVHDVAAQLRRGLPSLVAGGNFSAGLCFVDNAVDVLLRAAATDAAPTGIARAYNASDGSDITWARYFGDLARLLGAPPPRALPRLAARLLAPAAEAAWRNFPLSGRPPLTREALNIVGSHHRVPITRAETELGYRPLVPYDQALAATADYIAANL